MLTACGGLCEGGDASAWQGVGDIPGELRARPRLGVVGRTKTRSPPEKGMGAPEKVEGFPLVADGRAVNPGRREVGRPEVLGDGEERADLGAAESQEGPGDTGLWDAEGVGVMTAWRG